MLYLGFWFKCQFSPDAQKWNYFHLIAVVVVAAAAFTVEMTVGGSRISGSSGNSNHDDMNHGLYSSPRRQFSPCQAYVQAKCARGDHEHGQPRSGEGNGEGPMKLGLLDSQGYERRNLDEELHAAFRV